MLEIKNLTVKRGNNIILNNLNAFFQDGKISIIFGPNGIGKSTLLQTVAGLIKPEEGKIFFGEKDILEDISGLDVNEVQRRGISLSFQTPPEILGVRLKDVLKFCLKKDLKKDFSYEEQQMIERFKLTEFLNRDVNVNFSGGEKKRAEILQLLFMKPKILLLDEPDSGVDVESLRLIGKEINEYVKKENASALLVTHHGNIFDFIKPDEAFVMLNGQISECGDPKEVFKTISTKGFEACLNCKFWKGE